MGLTTLASQLLQILGWLTEYMHKVRVLARLRCYYTHISARKILWQSVRDYAVCMFYNTNATNNIAVWYISRYQSNVNATNCIDVFYATRDAWKIWRDACFILFSYCIDSTCIISSWDFLIFVQFWFLEWLYFIAIKRLNLYVSIFQSQSYVNLNSLSRFTFNCILWRRIFFLLLQTLLPNPNFW